MPEISLNVDNLSDEELTRINSFLEKNQQLTVTKNPIGASALMQQISDISTQEELIQQAEGQTGLPLQRTSTGVPAELDRPVVRADLQRANNIDEFRLTLEKHIPGIEIINLNQPVAGSRFALKIPGQSEMVLLDNKELASFSDFADAFGAIANTETLLAVVAALKTKGASLLTRILTTGGASSFGALIDEGVQEVRGLQTDSLEDIFKFDVSSAFIGGAGGELLAGPGRRGVNALVGRGTIDLLPEQREAVKQFRERGIRGPTIGSVQPGLGAIERQAVLTGKKAQDVTLSMRKEALEVFKESRDLIEKGNITDRQLDQIMADTAEAMRLLIFGELPEVSIERGGKALIEGRKIAKRVAKEWVGRKYDKALQAGDGASFDIRSVKQLANDIEKGVTGRKTIITTEQSKLFAEQLVKDVKEVPVQIRKLNAETREIIKTIKNLDPNVSAFEGNSAFEQIKELRTRLFDLKNATVDGKETIQNRLAGQLWDELTRVMDNPSGGSDTFNLLIRAANNANKRVERVKEITDIKRIGIETEPGNLAGIVKPGKSMTIRTLKRILPQHKFDQFRASYVSKLANDPLNIIRELDRFNTDPITLNIMLTQGEQKSLRELGNKMIELDSALQTIKKSPLGESKRASEVIKSGNIDLINTIVKDSGGKNSVAGRALRRALFNDIITSSEQTIKGITGVNPQAAQTAIKRLDDAGLLDAVLTPSEKDLLLKDKIMLSMFPSPPDPGAGIQAAELAASLAEPLNPIAVATNPQGVIKSFLSGAGGFTRNFIAGSILMNPQIAKAVIGSGAAKFDLTTIRILSIIASQSALDARSEAQKAKEKGSK